MVIRTRRDIVEACNRLLMKKNIENINVNEIIQEAGVSRATFYRYFRDKFDVMNYNYKIIVDSAVEGSSSFREMLQNIADRFANTIWKERHKIHDYTGINSFGEYIFQYSMAVAEDIVKANRDGERFTEAERLQMSILCYGISYISKGLLKNDFSASPEKVTEIIYSMLPETIRGYYV